MGAVTDVVKRYIPASYRAMVGTTNSYYSLSDLQDLADFVQYRLFSTVVGATNEATQYDLEHRELLGMLTAMQFIPAAIDYWSDQIQSESTTGTHEVVSYFDKRDSLWKLFAQIQKDAQLLAIDLGVSIQQARAVIPKISYGDNGRGVLITTDPAIFPRPRYGPFYYIPWGTSQ
jgi:hypothetical protein